MVETAIGMGRAATTAAPAQTVGKSVSGVFENLSRTLQGAEKSKATTPGATTSTARRSASAAAVVPKPASAASAPKPAVTYEDPSGIQEGMDSAEVARRFGPPALKLTTDPGQETLCYAKKATSIDVTVRSGKVTSVQKTGGTD